MISGLLNLECWCALGGLVFGLWGVGAQMLWVGFVGCYAACGILVLGDFLGSSFLVACGIAV